MSFENSGETYLDKSRETMPWNERQEILASSLRENIVQVAGKSKAYGEIFEKAGVDARDVKSLNDLASLPIVRMSDLVDRQKADPPFGGFETASPEDIRRVYINPGLIWQPADVEYQDASWAESLCGAGFKKGDMILNTFNYHMWPFAFMLDDSAKMIGAIVVPTGAGNTLMQVKILQNLGIKGFMGTPSFLNTLAQRAEDMGLDIKKDLSLERALVGAEMLPESLRNRLEKKLGMTIRQSYGTVFLGCIGYECSYGAGLHIPDDVIVEVVDPHSGKQVAPGAAGEIVATKFNRTFPLVRFATGDLSQFSMEPCPCGRTSPKLTRILGRVDEATKVRGTFVHPWQTDGVIARFPEVFKYQVVITRENDVDVMTFIVELTEEIDNPARLQHQMENYIKEMLTIKGRVNMAPRGTIPDFHKKIEDRRTWE